MNINAPSVVYPPNRPTERILGPSKMPVMYDFLFFVDINEHDELLLGCSNISGAYWEGTLFHYKNYPSYLDSRYEGYYISISSVADAKFIKGTNYAILAEDTGYLKLLNLSQNPQISCQDCFNTNARLEQLAVWSGTHQVLTCADTTVSVWDMKPTASINPIHEYKDFHTQLVTSIDVDNEQPNLFASASFDRKALIWDDRISNPASVVYENEFSSLTSISWNQTRKEYLAVGTTGGFVYIIDSRQPKEFIASKQCYDAAIHRMAFDESELLAVCGDSTELLVLDSKNNMEVAYKSLQHSEFVRGLTWSGGVLYSCGFDKHLLKHTV